MPLISRSQSTINPSVFEIEQTYATARIVVADPADRTGTFTGLVNPHFLFNTVPDKGVHDRPGALFSDTEVLVPVHGQGLFDFGLQGNEFRAESRLHNFGFRR